MRHPKLLKWEEKLRDILVEIDAILEDKYGRVYTLHPSRPRRGSTANAEDDGLFDVGAAYSAGFGSRHGPGYIVEVRMGTLHRVPAAARKAIEEEVADLLRPRLAKTFPGRHLHVDRDGPVWKIHGDLSLGEV